MAIKILESAFEMTVPQQQLRLGPRVITDSARGNVAVLQTYLCAVWREPNGGQS